MISKVELGIQEFISNTRYRNNIFRIIDFDFQLLSKPLNMDVDNTAVLI